MSLTIDSEINKVAYKALGDYKGTIAVVNYKTGDIVCMVSTPSYDPENVPSDLESNSKYEGAYINRFLTGLYTPGSTFKLVTTACALENKPEILNGSWNCKNILMLTELRRIRLSATHATVRLILKRRLRKAVTLRSVKSLLNSAPIILKIRLKKSVLLHLLS